MRASRSRGRYSSGRPYTASASSSGAGCAVYQRAYTAASRKRKSAERSITRRPRRTSSATTGAAAAWGSAVNTISAAAATSAGSGARSAVSTLTAVRYWPAVEVTSNGWCTIMREVSRPKYASSGRVFTTISPAPGWRRTRATEDFRLPVDQMTVTRSGLIAFSPALGERHRLLRLVRMAGTRVDLQLGRQASADAVLRQHAGHRVAHQAARMP